MSNLYSKVHRLKSQGWTWNHFLQQIDLIYAGGIDEKTLLALYRQPHRKASAHVNKVITTLHDNVFASPFPEDTQALLAIYNRLIHSKNNANVADDISDFIIFLNGDLQHGSTLRQARLHWIKADIHLDQLSNLRINGKKLALLSQQKLALYHYQQSYELLQELNSDQQNDRYIDDFTLYKVQQNMLACYLNSSHPQQRYQDNALHNYLLHSNYIKDSKRALHSEPYQWIIARNGLRFSSIQKNADNCDYFYRALISANSAFTDYNYAPLGAPAIINSEDFKWAIQQLTP
ncbi:MAG: hypothetical protein V7784_05545 [Oceanospirillaceae bacterium]